MDDYLTMRRNLRAKNKELGGTLMEYALLVALIATVALAGVPSVGAGVRRQVCKSVVALDGGSSSTGSEVDGDGCPIVGSKS